MRTPTPKEVLTIRGEYDAGTLRTRWWAQTLGVGVETVRRIARRDTYRTVGGQAGLAPQKQRPVGTPEPTLNLTSEEPGEDELAASLERFRELAAHPDPERVAAELLDELTKKGHEG